MIGILDRFCGICHVLVGDDVAELSVVDSSGFSFFFFLFVFSSGAGFGLEVEAVGGLSNFRAALFSSSGVAST